MFFGILVFVLLIFKVFNGMFYFFCEYEYICNCNLGFVVSFEDYFNNFNMSLYCDVF